MTNNSICCPSGTNGTVGTVRNGPLNLLYSTMGDLPRERDGKKIYVQHIDVSLLFQQPMQSSITSAYSYLRKTLLRVVAYECDNTECGMGAAIPADLFADPNLYSGTIGAGINSENLMQRPTNPKYRILKDNIYDLERDSLVIDGILDDPIYAIGTQRILRFKIKLNKNYDYEETGENSVCPHRTVQLVIVPYNNLTFGNTENLGTARFYHTMYFKDV